jgi:WD40 repeat protein
MLLWLYGNGQTQMLHATPTEYFGPIRFSPDGKRPAVSVVEGGYTNIWVYDLERDTITPRTFTQSFSGVPVWSPDGKHIAFASSRHGGPMNVYWMRSDGAGEVVRLTENVNEQLPFSFSPDGKLAFNELNPQTGEDLWTLPRRHGERPPEARQAKAFSRHAIYRMGAYDLP